STGSPPPIGCSVTAPRCRRVRSTTACGALTKETCTRASASSADDCAGARAPPCGAGAPCAGGLHPCEASGSSAPLSAAATMPSSPRWRTREDGRRSRIFAPLAPSPARHPCLRRGTARVVPRRRRPRRPNPPSALERAAGGAHQLGGLEGLVEHGGHAEAL